MNMEIASKFEVRKKINANYCNLTILGTWGEGGGGLT
jgi:hypothetical protein